MGATVTAPPAGSERASLKPSHDPANPPSHPSRLAQVDGCLLFVAAGFGSGWLRPGPGTWGSGLGLACLWFATRCGYPRSGAVWGIALAAAAIPICGRAARIRGEKDPGWMVLDEIVGVIFGIPAGWILAGYLSGHAIGEAAGLWSGSWPVLLPGFALFRILDIFKPWPVGAVQRLPGGWGIVADDVLAGVAAGCLLWFVHG